MRLAITLVALGAPPLAALMFVPDELLRARDVLAWRERTSPMAYLEDRRWGLYRDVALAELDAEQRASGLVSRLFTPRTGDRMRRYGDQFTSAAFHPDGRELLSGSGTVAVRWEIATGKRIEEIGPRRRKDIEDSSLYGFGFNEVAWTDAGQTVAALTSSPSALWLLRGGALGQRLRLEGPGHEQLSSRDTRLAWMRSLEYGVVLQRPGELLQKLPHEEVTAVALADEGRAITASRRSLQWWLGGVRERTVPIEAQGNPVAFSTDRRWALAPVQRHLELWRTDDGTRQRIEHEQELRAACATAEYLATGTEDGRVHLWSTTDWQLRRSFRSSAGAIDLLVCHDERLLVIGDHRSDARVWDVAGRAQQAPVPEVAPPHLSWIARRAADDQLERRFPRLVGWLVDNNDDGQMHIVALGGLLVLFGVARWLWRRGL